MANVPSLNTTENDIPNGDMSVPYGPIGAKDAGLVYPGMCSPDGFAPSSMHQEIAAGLIST